MRAGSKRLPGKHTRMLCGASPARIVVDAAESCKMVEGVYVATNDLEIRDQFKDDPRVTLFERSEEGCTDLAPSEVVIREFAEQVECENIVLIQATNPFINSQYLYAGIEAYEASRCDSLMSVAPLQRYTYERHEDGLLESLSFYTYERRGLANTTPIYVENGSFYIFKRADFLAHGRINYGRRFGFVMGAETIHELDTETDWKVCEALLGNNQHA